MCPDTRYGRQSLAERGRRQYASLGTRPALGIKVWENAAMEYGVLYLVSAPQARFHGAEGKTWTCPAPAACVRALCSSEKAEAPRKAPADCRSVRRSRSQEGWALSGGPCGRLSHPAKVGILFAVPFDNASGELRIVKTDREYRAQALGEGESYETISGMCCSARGECGLVSDGNSYRADSEGE